MNATDDICLSAIFKSYSIKIGLTWLLVILETIGVALVPLAMGIAIDGLLADDPSSLVWLGGLMVALTIAATLRRLYDTRVYGSIRVKLGTILDSQAPHLDVSTRSARLDMGRELADFMEEELPDLLTALVQIIMTLVILAAYDIRLMLSALALAGGMMALYAVFHRTLYRCNSGFNNRLERQVNVLVANRPRHLLAHLLGLKKWEVRISDREAILFGLIFLQVTAFIIYNIMLCADLDNITAGRIFTILSYSWEYVEAALTVPITLLFFTRIREITARIKTATQSQ